MRRTTTLLGAVSIMATATMIGACSPSPLTNQGAKPTNVSTAQDLPDFKGPYASDFRDAYLQTQSSKARQILATGQITEADFSEIQADHKICLENQGFSDIVHYPSGGMEVTPPAGISLEDEQRLMRTCSEETGIVHVEALLNAISINPNNEDIEELAVQCMIDRGLVEPSFTVADLDAWYVNEDPRLRPGTPESDCETDPLGLLER